MEEAILAKPSIPAGPINNASACAEGGGVGPKHVEGDGGTMGKRGMGRQIDEDRWAIALAQIDPVNRLTVSVDMGWGIHMRPVVAAQGQPGQSVFIGPDRGMSMAFKHRIAGANTLAMLDRMRQVNQLGHGERLQNEPCRAEKFGKPLAVRQV